MRDDRWYVLEERTDPGTGEVHQVVLGEHTTEAEWAEAVVAASDDLAARKARGAAHSDDLVGGRVPRGAASRSGRPFAAPQLLRARRRLAAELGDGAE